VPGVILVYIHHLHICTKEVHTSAETIINLLKPHSIE
jgi:hypothetical protein